MSARPVPVPAGLSIGFLVMTAEPLDRQDLVPLPDRSLLRLRGSSIAALHRMTGLPYQRLVSRVVSAREAVEAAESARRQAMALAARHDGLVIDLQKPCILEDDPDRPRLASEWFTFEYDPDHPAQIRTHGLALFGLPEIVVNAVPDGARAHYDMVVVGLVQRLIQEWPEHDPVGPVTVTLSDMMAGYEQDRGPRDAAKGVGVLVDYDSEEHELVVSVVDDPRSTFFG